ncbi:hypothetical protein GNI_101360 [Gregarina niphandrodes]|uniref:Uncharacterized protein n=1 Tax=Gregarina niphandrodes TaxID=110365 RepID=A0A023B4J2_GRENI|nr:hypothetical protein GNI_101360 [Gregarina niphandrodes]EZG56754.1 hypothetical protein GNI_101360 [Gregarina niphandrodes]|eukprot:XP_011131163.1 hypothetical protein GNI_101360 [Gregarina niphandrodes]
MALEVDKLKLFIQKCLPPADGKKRTVNVVRLQYMESTSRGEKTPLSETPVYRFKVKTPKQLYIYTIENEENAQRLIKNLSKHCNVVVSPKVTKKNKKSLII